MGEFSRQGVSQYGPAEALVRECLARIEEENDRLKAFITVMPDQAIADARRADEAARHGKSLGLLHGMPVSVKDCIDVAGVRCTNGSPFFANYVPEEDAESVRRLRQEGAIILGKTNLHELCFGSTTQNPHFGKGANPWDPRRIPSGSSGGAGASVAADMCVGALGSDTGGSIRTPAAINGVSGLRPTHGAISMHGTQIQCSARFDTFGPLARRVTDVARMFAVLAGYDRRDPVSRHHEWGSFLPELSKGIKGVRIGIPRNFIWEESEPDIARAFQEAIETLKRLGAVPVDLYLAQFEEAQHAPMALVLAEGASFHRKRIEEHPECFGEDVISRLRLGFDVTGMQYADAERWRQRWARTVSDAFESADVILMPTTPTTAPSADDAREMLKTTLRITRFTFPFTWAGCPGLSVPCGFSSEGLPIGLLINGPAWSEALLLRIGAAYQRETDWHERRPHQLATAE